MIRTVDGPVDLRGRIFGTWRVLPELPRRRATAKSKGPIVWKCLCNCGYFSEVAAYALLSGNSLGCYSCGRKKIEKSAEHTLYKQIQYNAIQRSILFNVTYEFIFGLLKKQNYLCALSGLPIVVAEAVHAHAKGGTTASLDRIDSRAGYTSNNVQWVHKDINLMKLDKTQEEFIGLCKAVAEKSSAR